MNLTTLRTRTQRYVRDIAGKRFSTNEIDAYINEGVDRLRSYSVFRGMPYPNVVDEISHLPQAYHYILALYASARCFGVDNDFYQEQQKRNEFENMFLELITQIENEDITILDTTGGGEGVEVELNFNRDYVEDEYFNPTSSGGGVIE